eukprot:IDg4077t1
MEETRFMIPAALVRARISAPANQNGPTIPSLQDSDTDFDSSDSEIDDIIVDSIGETEEGKEYLKDIAAMSGLYLLQEEIIRSAYSENGCYRLFRLLLPSEELQMKY